MRYVKPRGIISGFHADDPVAQAPELVHVGEQWAATDYVIARHQHRVWEFYLQIDGHSVWADTAGKRYDCPPGALYAPPPRLEHWLVRASGRHHFYFAAIDVQRVIASRLPELRTAWSNTGTIHRVRGQACEASFRALVREVSVVRAFRDQGVRAAVDALVIDVARLIQHAATGKPLVASHPAVEHARALLDAHPAEPWTLAGLGRLTGLSPNHLARLFTEHFSLSPHAYLVRNRIARAKDLLRHTDASITQIAMDLGFASSQHFARVFRAQTGKTARHFRGGNARWRPYAPASRRRR